MASQDEFERAVAIVGTSKVPTSNNVKLELYAYYKIATVAATPGQAGQSRPGMFDFAGRAKFDTWARIGGESTASPDEARKRYIETATTHLGYDPTQHHRQQPESKPLNKGKRREEDMTADELLDREDEQEDGNGGKGMTSVSTMRLDDEPLSEPEAAKGSVRSSLHDLASAGDIDKLRILQPSAEACNAADQYGFTPLHLATDRGHVKVVRYLIERGAERSIQDSEGATALDTAKILENEELILLLEQ